MQKFLVGLDVGSTTVKAIVVDAATGNVLEAANPDAVLIAGSGTPAALPARTLKERGYKGTIY